MECGYSFITSGVLAYFFHRTQNRTGVITPEFNYQEAHKPDYTISSITRNPYLARIHAVVEVKSKREKLTRFARTDVRPV